MLGFIRERLEPDQGFHILVEEEDDGRFVATSPALPGYVAYGHSEGSATRKLRRAIRRNMEDVAADHRKASRWTMESTSRHKSRLWVEPPFTTTTKLVFASAALAALAVLAYELSRRDD